MLFSLGDLSLLDRPAVAIVGTRNATSYGLRATATLARAAGEAGVTVVSGMARGVDAMAHEVALGTAGGTIAVLGTGVDVPYPRENAALHARVAARGLVLSEMLPGAPPHAGSFPRRNRLVAALADVTLVVEAGVRSGALITATIADSLGHLVGAVPGPIDSAASRGSNQLLRDGKHVVAAAEDVIALINLTPRGRAVSLRRSPDALALPEGDEGVVLAVVRDGPRLPDELIAATGLSPSRLAAAVGALGEQGLAGQDASGWIRVLAGAGE